jgi:hypothetical protein
MNNLVFLLSIVIIFVFCIYQAIYILLNEYTGVFLKVFSVLIIVAVFNLAIRHTTYLPFLGKTVVPEYLIKDSFNNNGPVKVTVDVDAPDNTRVLFWASKSSPKIFKTPLEAYTGSVNGGVTMVKGKKAVFNIECPAGYNVNASTLSPHVHYRVVMPKGMLSPVKTVKVDCKYTDPKVVTGAGVIQGTIPMPMSTTMQQSDLLMPNMPPPSLGDDMRPVEPSSRYSCPSREPITTGVAMPSDEPQRFYETPANF